MLVTRRSIFSGLERTIDLPVTEQQLGLWAAGHLIQSVMPHLDDDQREFLISGMTPEEWDEMNGDDEATMLDMLDPAYADDDDPTLRDEDNNEEDEENDDE